MAAVYELNGDTLTVTTKTQAALLERLGYERTDAPKRKKEPEKKEPQYTEEEWNAWLEAEKKYEDSQSPALTEEDLGKDENESEEKPAPKRTTTRRK